MTHKKHAKKILLGILLTIIVILLGVQLLKPKEKPVVIAPVVKTVPKNVLIAPTAYQGTEYHTITMMTTDTATELASTVGSENIQTVLEINRIDSANIKKGKVLVIPNSFDDVAALSPFPATLANATDIPKLMVVSLPIQAFAIYESGNLVRWGGVNTGKQSTPTPSQLFFANWKGKLVTSSEDDSWILPWYVNLDNKEGVSMHQYELPGYPASHACIRLLEQDAEWIYNWVDQWKVSDNGETVLGYGTPVLVFGQYAYGTTAPWKKLAKNPDATTISEDALEAIIAPYKDSIAEHAS